MDAVFAIFTWGEVVFKGCPWLKYLQEISFLTQRAPGKHKGHEGGNNIKPWFSSWSLPALGRRHHVCPLGDLGG
jgi:hypothetical protein